MLTHRGLKAIALAAWVDISAAASHRHLHLTRRLHRTRARRQQTEICAWRTAVLKARAFQAREEQGRQKQHMQRRRKRQTVVLAWHTHARRQKWLRVSSAALGFRLAAGSALKTWKLARTVSHRSRVAERRRRARGNRFLCSIILR